MKRLKFHRAIVAIAMMLIAWLPSLAHDFEINGVFYNVISTTEVEVTYKGSSNYEYDDEYSGSVVIPSLVEYGGFTYSVTSIGYYAFDECTSLTSIQIPNSVTSIGEYAFEDCSSLTSVIIGNSVTSIGHRAFSCCTSLTSIEIPNSITSIGDFAFENCSSLTSIQIPNSVTSIGNNAFAYCESLTSIEIPNSVTSIGERAFYNCDSLTDVVIGNSVTSIGEGAFYDCKSLTSVVIGNSVTSIGDYAFRYCKSLTEITCWVTTPPTIYSNTFSNYSADLYVPVGCKAAYKNAEYWENFYLIKDTLDNPVTLNDNDAIVVTIGDNIVVKNAKLGSVVNVYAADGAMIASEFATEGDVIIEAPTKGIYVVKVGKQTVKVII